MKKIINAVERLSLAVVELAEQQSRLTTSMNNVAREQRITNLIVRSQISGDADEKDRLMRQASGLMNEARRRSSPTGI